MTRFLHGAAVALPQHSRGRRALAADPPAVGAAAPAFKLQDQTGKWHALSDYKGKWVVLYFYPKDNTPGCTTQACEFRDNIFAYRELGAVILGVSVDDVASHKAFSDEHSLPFPILADCGEEDRDRLRHADEVRRHRGARAPRHLHHRSRRAGSRSTT